MQTPETHYARVDDLRIAYQQWGDGPPLLICPDLISNVEIAWEHELYRRTLEHLGKHMTCLWFDKRGIGLSDRFDDVPTLEQRIRDINAVMDAVGWKRSHFVGQSEGAVMGQLFVTRHLIDEKQGRVVKSTGDGLLATFESPSQGVLCGLEMAEALAGIGVRIRAGVHAGEIEVHDDGDISGVAVNLAARVEQRAADGEFWASSTVKDLMLGGNVSFSERGEHELKGIDGSWRLFSVNAA